MVLGMELVVQSVILQHWYDIIKLKIVLGYFKMFLGILVYTYLSGLIEDAVSADWIDDKP